MQEVAVEFSLAGFLRAWVAVFVSASAPVSDPAGERFHHRVMALAKRNDRPFRIAAPRDRHDVVIVSPPLAVVGEEWSENAATVAW